MVRLFGKDFSSKKKLKSALLTFKGLNHATIDSICKQLKLKENIYLIDLKSKDTFQLSEAIKRASENKNNMLKTMKENISKLKENGCYRGMRHSNRLPVRGQRTRTNRKTQKKLATIRFN